MGYMMTKLMENCSFGVPNILNGLASYKRKRWWSNDPDGCVSAKRRRLTSSMYVYKVLYQEMEDSDITIWALGKEWHLHKMYIIHSPYFRAMFGGSWRETHEDAIHIKIMDERITVEILDSIFGSMYFQAVDIDGDNCVGLLAAATYFHLDDIIEKCVQVMNENINVFTVIAFYDAALTYNCRNVRKNAFKWLEINLLSVYNEYPNLLRQIDVDLMADLLASPDLYVIQTEFSLYLLLRTWIYLHFHPNFNGRSAYELQPRQDTKRARNEPEEKRSTDIIDAYNVPIINCDGLIKKDGTNGALTQEFYASFQRPKSGPKNVLDYTGSDFLNTLEGSEYIKCFKLLRVQHMMNNYKDLQVILQDKILPQAWITEHAFGHWKAALEFDNCPEFNQAYRDPQFFHKHAFRCGRLQLDRRVTKWRWEGFAFDVDLVFTYDGANISVKRLHSTGSDLLMGSKYVRHLMLKFNVASIIADRQPIRIDSTNIIRLSLREYEETTVMSLSKNLKVPFLLTAKILVLPPNTVVYRNFCNFRMITTEFNSNTEISQVPSRIEHFIQMLSPRALVRRLASNFRGLNSAS